MNIWLINHYAVPPQYYPLARPANFAKYLKRLGHDVTIFAASTVHNSDKNLIEGKELYRDDYVGGIHYVYIRCRNYQGNGLKRIVNMCEFAYKLPRVCAHYDKPDAIVSTSVTPMACAEGIRLSKKYKCKGVAEIADLWPESIVAYGFAGPRNPAVLFLRRLEKWIYTRCDALVFTAEGSYDYIREQGWEKAVPKEKVYYLNNGVDLETFDYNKEHFQIDDEDLKDPKTFKVVYTGSIRRVNNLGLILDAAKLIKEKSIVFLIWGDGDELPMLRERAAAEKIDNVVFKGRVEKKYVPYITSMADLNIAHNTPSPLFKYGISFNKLFDYLAAGKPVFSDFPCPYNPAIQFGAGLDVSDASAENIAARIEEFRSMDPAALTAYGRNARLAAEQEYDFRVLTEKLLTILQKSGL